MPDYFDPPVRIQMLPPSVLARLASIRARLEDLMALARAAYDDEIEANRALGRAREALGTTRAAKPNGPTAAQLESAEAAVQRAQETAERLRDRAEARRARSNALGNLVHSIEAFLRKATVPLEAFPVQTPKLNKGEATAAAVERVRLNRAKLNADLHRVRSQPVPASEVRALIKDQVAALAARGQPDLFGMIEGASTFSFAQSERWLDSVGRVVLPPIGETPARHLEVVGRAFDRGPDLLGLIAWFLGPALIARLEEELALIASDGSAIPAEERAARVADLQSSILANERDEEELIRTAEAQGQEIARRADADPRAILSVN